MDSKFKQNDIFVASISKPDATLLDLYKNDINAENTQFLPMDVYKKTPFVLKRYTMDGVFDEEKFNNDYINASKKWLELTDDEAVNNLKKEIEYSPTSIYAPINSKKFDTSVSYEQIMNPGHLAIGLTQINQMEDQTKTNEELAQMNRIWDTENQKWLDETPETLNIFKKVFGNTLNYAIWESDGYDDKGNFHRAGDWKTDEQGNYYTETLGDRQLGNKQVVKLEDILTKEDTLLNKYDFLDSDGYEKSITGTIAKTALSIAPYLVPWLKINKIYGGVATVLGLGEAVPAFYKNMEALLTGDTNSGIGKSATYTENWFKKFEHSMSKEGQDGFMSLESIGTMVSDVFSLIYQQRNMASLSKLFISDDAVKADKTFKTALKRNKLSQDLALGYMALVSAADTYNDALNANYDPRSAGLAGLLTAGSLYGIMGFNESTRGLGTWFLDKTTGYSEDVSRKAFNKPIKELWKSYGDDLKTFIDLGNKKGIRNTLSNFKEKAKLKAYDILNNTEGIWTKAIVEGVEEVSEEAVQDAVKGMMDTLSWLGYTLSKGSFGGFKNVFSIEGLKRYMTSLLGGALGGALFDVQSKYINPWVNGEEINRNIDKKSITQLILEGKEDMLLEEVDRYKKIFNQKTSPMVMEINGEMVAMPVQNEGKTQADLIADAVKREIYETKFNIEQELGPLKDVMAQLNSMGLSDKLDPIMKTFNEGVRKEFSSIASNIVSVKDEIKDINNQLNGESAKDLLEEKKIELNKNLEYKTNKLKRLVNKANSFFGGENVSRNIIKYQLFRNKPIRDSFALTYDPSDDSSDNKIFALDLDSYAYNRYKVIYNDLLDPDFKEQIKTEWELLKDNTSDEKIIDTLNLLSDLYIEEAKSLTPYLKDFEYNSLKKKYWMQTINLFDETFNMGEDAFIYKNPDYKQDDDVERGINSLAKIQATLKNFKSFSLRDLKNIDIANILFDSGVIELQENRILDEKGKIVNDPLFKLKLELVKKIINQQAARLNIKSGWDEDMLTVLINNVRDILNIKPRSNIYINKLYDLYSDQNLSVDEVTENLNFTLNDNLANFDKNNNALANINKLTSREILKYIDLSKYISQDIYNHLNTEIDNYVNRTFNKLIKNSLENSVIDKSDVSILLNSNNKYDILKYFFSENENINLIKNFDEDIQKVLSDMRQLALYNSQDTLEFQHYDAIKDKLSKIKIVSENPIYSLIKNVFRKFTYNDKLMTIFDYLLTKELEINSLQTSLLLKYKDNEKEEVIDMLMKTLKHLSGIIDGSTNFNGETSLTDKIKEFQQEYYNENVSEKYYSINENTRQDINKILNSLLNKLVTIENLYKANSELTKKVDLDRDYKINKMLINFYKEPLMIGDKVVVDEKKYNEGIDDDETWLLEREIEIHKAFNNPENSEEDNQKLKENFLKDFINNFPDSWNNIYNINDIIYTEDSDGKLVLRNKIHGGFALLKVLSLMNIDPLELDQKYLEALANNSKLIRTSYQEMVFKLAYAQINNAKSKKLSNFALKLLHEKLQEVTAKDNTIFNNQFCKGLLFANGAAGSGKSTAAAKMLNEARPSDITLVAAPTVSKAQDFGLAINNDKNSGLIVWGGNNSLMSNLYEESDKLFEFRSKFLTYLNTTLGEELKNQKDGDAIYEFTHNGITAKIQINKSGNYSSAKDFKFEGLDDLTLLNSDKTINVFVDEATLLDPFSIALLSNYGEKVENSMVVVLGDSLQNGFIYKINGITNKWGINEYFTLRTPYMTNMFRANNTGVLDNCTLLKNVASICNHPYKQITIKEQTYIDLLNIFDLNKLKYKIDSQNNKLYGHEITNNNSVLKDRLTLILNDIKDTNDKLSILLPELEDSSINIEDTDEYKEITTLLSSLGYTNKNFEIYSENHLTRGIQGSESKYVLLYDLKTKSDLEYTRNYDTDTLSIYTYASRPKDYELIFEKDSSKGLFGFYHIDSKENDIDLINNVDNTAKEASKEYIENRKKVLETFGIKSTNKDSSTDDDDNSDDDDSDDDSDDDNSDDDDSDDDSDDDNSDDDEGKGKGEGGENKSEKKKKGNKNNKDFHPDESIISNGPIETEVFPENVLTDEEDKEKPNSTKSDSKFAKVIKKSPLRYSFNKYHKQLDSTGNLLIDNDGNLNINYKENENLQNISDTDYIAYAKLSLFLMEDLKDKNNLKKFSKFIDSLFYDALNFSLNSTDGKIKSFKIKDGNGNLRQLKLKSLKLFKNPTNEINPFDKPNEDPEFKYKSTRVVLLGDFILLDGKGHPCKLDNTITSEENADILTFTFGAIRNLNGHNEGLTLLKSIKPNQFLELDINKIIKLKDELRSTQFFKDIVEVNPKIKNLNNDNLIANFLIPVTNLRDYVVDTKHIFGINGLNEKNHIPLSTFNALSNLTQIPNSDIIFNKDLGEEFFKWYNSYRMYPLSNEMKNKFLSFFYNKRWALFGFAKKAGHDGNNVDDYRYVIPIAIDKFTNFKKFNKATFYNHTMFINALWEIVCVKEKLKRNESPESKMRFSKYYYKEKNRTELDPKYKDEFEEKFNILDENLKLYFGKNNNNYKKINAYIQKYKNYISHKPNTNITILELTSEYNNDNFQSVFLKLNKDYPNSVLEYEPLGSKKQIPNMDKNAEYVINYVYEDPQFVVDLNLVLKDEDSKKINNKRKPIKPQTPKKSKGNVSISNIKEKIKSKIISNLKTLGKSESDSELISKNIINNLSDIELSNFNNLSEEEFTREVTNKITLYFNNNNVNILNSEFDKVFTEERLEDIYNHFETNMIQEEGYETFEDYILSNHMNISFDYKEELHNRLQNKYHIGYDNMDLLEKLEEYVGISCRPF